MKALRTEEIFSDDDFYPESDGKPMADSTKQYEWIVRIKEGLEFLFRNNPDVFVAADLLWYPTKGERHTSIGPDVMVAIGRPKGHRRSYLQWKEGDIAPQVVFEILSPSNHTDEMREKLKFYERYGVEEYYVYDPDKSHFEVHMRLGKQLRSVENAREWTSPSLGIRFEHGEDLRIFHPDGRAFLLPLEAMEQADLEKAQERKRAEKAELESVQERQRADQERQRAEKERQRAERLAEKLRALGIDPDGE